VILTKPVKVASCKLRIVWEAVTHAQTKYRTYSDGKFELIPEDTGGIDRTHLHDLRVRKAASSQP